jgi:hypothetical protein
MWRWIVVALLAANGLYWAWSQHWLASLGSAPRSEREPQRLQMQTRPESVRVLPASAVRAPAPPASAPGTTS